MYIYTHEKISINITNVGRASARLLYRNPALITNTEQSQFDHLSLEPTVISSMQELSDPELFDNAIDSTLVYEEKLLTRLYTYIIVGKGR